MSSDCKIVRGISLFLCFVGVVSVAAAVIMFLYAPSAGLASEDDVLIAQVSAGVLLAVGLLDLVCGVMGARLSKTPAKLKPFVWAACAVCVVNIVTSSAASPRTPSTWSGSTRSTLRPPLRRSSTRRAPSRPPGTTRQRERAEGRPT